MSSKTDARRVPFFQGNGQRSEPTRFIPPPPPWRVFRDKSDGDKGRKHIVREQEVALVNAALCLRRPLLLTGKPGSGKTSLPYAVAYELGLGEVIVWPINSKSTLKDGLYQYDSIARLQDASLSRAQSKNGNAPDIGQYLRLGPLGSAFVPSEKPRVLLIDEIDKSDIDLPNDLLHIFELGRFDIPELVRLPSNKKFANVQVPLWQSVCTYTVPRGRVACKEFPLVFLSSNGEREFPPAFLRRCLRLDIPEPSNTELMMIVKKHLGLGKRHESLLMKLISEFQTRKTAQGAELATDQLMNAVFLAVSGHWSPSDTEKDDLKMEIKDAIFRSISPE